MKIRHANMEELDMVMELYDQGRRFMRSSGNTEQWINGYPDRELIAQDIRRGRSYVLEADGALAGVFCFFCGEGVEPAYADLDGEWLPDSGIYGVMHRVASNGKVPGLVSLCADWCLEQCGSLRIDTHEDNRPMRQALERKGFQYCGMVTYADEGDRLAYQILKTQ